MQVNIEAITYDGMTPLQLAAQNDNTSQCWS